jgi:hypothetical protein
MESREALIKAVDLMGMQPLAKEVGRSYQAVQQWVRKGRLPRTDYSGETDYASQISAACTAIDPECGITRERLLGLKDRAAA